MKKEKESDMSCYSVGQSTKLAPTKELIAIKQGVGTIRHVIHNIELIVPIFAFQIGEKSGANEAKFSKKKEKAETSVESCFISHLCFLTFRIPFDASAFELVHQPIKLPSVNFSTALGGSVNEFE